MLKFPKKSKYNASKIRVDGIKFDSKLEANCYNHLKDKFPDLKLQPKFLLQHKFKRNGKTIRKIEYVADFKFTYNNQVIVIDSKGMETDVFKLKYKLLVYKYPKINFYTVKSLKKLKELLKSLNQFYDYTKKKKNS